MTAGDDRTAPGAGPGVLDAREASHRLSPASAGSRSYRYPGSPPFRDVAVDRLLFKGRDEEARTVLHSILSSDLFLLYAVSGMGKSSLLNAGVMHQLRARGYFPVSVRVNDTTMTPTEGIRQQIVEAVDADDEVDLVRTPGIDLDVSGNLTLWDVLGATEVWRGSRLQHLVVVLDQFEELFTLDWPRDVRDRFIAEFGEVVRRSRSLDGDVPASSVPPPDVKFVLVVREDALGELEALAEDVPHVMQHRFRLGPLDPERALAAIREPAMIADDELATQQFTYSEDAATQILDFLQQTEQSSSAVTAAARAARSVDPSQLQIVCQYVERRVLPTKGSGADGAPVQIEASDLGGTDGLRSILGDFYRRTVASFPDAERRRIRELCERGLISSSQRRLSLESGVIDDAFDVPAAVLDSLVDHRLLRAEPRVGSVYYELAHDTLVQPILADREQHRRERSQRRRRRVATAGAFVGLLAMIVLVAAMVSGEESDDPDSVPPTTAVATTTTLPELVADARSPSAGGIRTAGDVSRFTFEGRDAPTTIVVTPDDAELNAAIAVSSTSGVGWAQDQLGRGAAETVVVPSAAGEEWTVTITSNDQSTGGFTIEAIDARVVALTTDQPRFGAIDVPGATQVYLVETDGTVAIDVVPRTGDPQATEQVGARNKGVDIEVHVIGPSGVRRRIDAAGPGERESTTVDGSRGATLIVVRGYLTSTGEYEIAMSAVDRRLLSTVEPLTNERITPGQPTEYAIQVTGTGAAAIVTPDATVDVMIEVVGPIGESRFVDTSGAGGIEAAHLEMAGEHLVRVSSYGDGPGAFGIRAVGSTVLAPDEPVTSEATPAAFVVGDDLGDVWTITAEPAQGDDLLQVLVTGPGGYLVGSGESTDEGDPVTVVVDGPASVSGSDLVIVGVADGNGGAVVRASPVEPVRLLAGEQAAPARTPVAFDVVVDQDVPLVFTAAPNTAQVLRVQVNSAGGFPLAFGRSTAEGEPAIVLVGGRPDLGDSARIIVTTDDGAVDMAVDLARVEPTALTVGQERAGMTTPAAFEFDVPPGELVVLSAQQQTEAGRLTMQVDGPGGYRTASRQAVGDGDPVAVLLGGSADREGTHRITVTSAVASNEFDVRADPVRPVFVVAGATAVSPAPAVFDVNVADATLSVLTVSGRSPDDLLDIGVFGPDVGAAQTASASAPGVPLSVLLDGAAATTADRRAVVHSTGLGDSITATHHIVSAQPITVGDELESVATPAVFDVIVDEGEALRLEATIAEGGGILSAQAYGPGGFAIEPASVFQPLPSIEQLPPEVVELFSEEVQALFADGLPASVDEAVAQLSAAGLLDEVITVLNENEIAADALLAEPEGTTEPAQVTVDVGGFGPGRYRVVVNTSEPATGLIVRLTDS